MKRLLFSIYFLLQMLCFLPTPAQAESVARKWNKVLLNAIRIDFPAPTVHSRNLYHVSAAMYDAWASYNATSQGRFYTQKHTADSDADIDESISYAAYRILSKRYSLAVDPESSQALFDTLMSGLGYDANVTTTVGDTPAAIGNKIAQTILDATLDDGSNESNSYEDNTDYEAVNKPMIVDHPSITGPSGPRLRNINHWQPLFINSAVAQNGIVVGTSLQTYIGPHWGNVETFALGKYGVNTPYSWSGIDPGEPPQFESQDFLDNTVLLIRYSSELDPNSGAGSRLINISPKVSGNRPLGTHTDQGYNINPFTGESYTDNIVNAADYGRILAEFWADGPDSETPPGHWNVIANDVSDHPETIRKIQARGKKVDELEWDVKLYFALNAAVHDAAIAAWGTKREYDYSRPISMIRYLGGLGQSSNPALPSYDPNGLPLEDGLIELITAQTIAAGGKHRNVYDNANQDKDGAFLQNFTEAELVNKIAVYAWNHEPDDPENQVSGVNWILAENWVPYQKDNFVTPAFAAYVSGHSTFSRAAAEVLSLFTGSEYFPGGLGEKTFAQNHFLEFEKGPSQDVTLQWAKYYDAADEAGISRLYGGIHVPPDDFSGRIMGSSIGIEAFEHASLYMNGTFPTDLEVSGLSDQDIVNYILAEINPLIRAHLPKVLKRTKHTIVFPKNFVTDTEESEELKVVYRTIIKPYGKNKAKKRVKRTTKKQANFKRLRRGRYTAEYRILITRGDQVIAKSDLSKKARFLIRANKR